MALEDYTTYTELDANSRYVVTTNKIAVTRIERDDVDQYVVFDKGAAFFDGDFTHQLKLSVTEATGGITGIWCVSNLLDELLAQTDALYVRYQGAAGSLLLIEEVSNTIYTDASGLPDVGTPYWLTIIRDESIGSFGQLQLFFYDDEAKTSLIDTMTLTLHSKVDWRYIYGTIGYGAVGPDTDYVTGDIENLDLGINGPIVSGFPFFFDAGHY